MREPVPLILQQEVRGREVHAPKAPLRSWRARILPRWANQPPAFEGSLWALWPMKPLSPLSLPPSGNARPLSRKEGPPERQHSPHHGEPPVCVGTPRATPLPPRRTSSVSVPSPAAPGSAVVPQGSVSAVQFAKRQSRAQGRDCLAGLREEHDPHLICSLSQQSPWTHRSCKVNNI